MAGNVDLFIKFKDVEGESKDDKHGKESHVLSVNWGATNSGSASHGSGLGAGKAEVKNLTVRKYVDKASPNLFLFCCNGKHLDECVLTARKAGEKPLDYVVITMSNCIITSVEIEGADSTDLLIEDVSIGFSKFKMEYMVQGDKGTSEGTVTATWDLRLAKAG